MSTSTRHLQLLEVDPPSQVRNKGNVYPLCLLLRRRRVYHRRRRSKWPTSSTCWNRRLSVPPHRPSVYRRPRLELSCRRLVLLRRHHPHHLHRIPHRQHRPPFLRYHLATRINSLSLRLMLIILPISGPSPFCLRVRSSRRKSVR